METAMAASRIANVTAAVLVGLGQGARSSSELADRMAALFEDTLWIGDPPPDGAPGRFVSVASAQRDPVAGVAAAIEAARGERVIVVAEVQSARVGAELLLALVAWPERAVVMVVEAEKSIPVCAIYRREDLLERARKLLASPSSPTSLETFLSGLEVERVTLARLGLGGGPHPLFAGRELREAC